MPGSLTYEGPRHPLLELTSEEQAVLLRAERNELGTAVVHLADVIPIRRLRELGLIEVQDDAWRPTAPRGQLVAHLFSRIAHGRRVAASPSAPEKKAAIAAEVEASVRELVSKIRALRV